MQKILVISIAVLVAIGLFLYQSNKRLKTELKAANGEITTLNSKIKGYENEIQAYNEAQQRASNTIEKVRTIIRTVESDCDCYNTALPDDVRRLFSGKE